MLWLSCGTTEPDQTLPNLPADQAILFEVEYVNHAWGYKCSGWYIDREGQVYSYSYEHGDDPWQPQDHKAITEQELLEKYSHGAEFLGNVDSIEFATVKGLILASAVGSMSDTTQRCADFGTVRYLAYVREDSTLTYHPVLLYQHGDMALRNLSTQARTLFDWLREQSGDSGEIECGAP
jgi:hypothetical protein